MTARDNGNGGFRTLTILDRVVVVALWIALLLLMVYATGRVHL